MSGGNGVLVHAIVFGMNISFDLQQIEVIGEHDIRPVANEDGIQFWLDAALYCLHQQHAIRVLKFREPVTITPMAIFDAVHPVKSRRT